MHIERSAGGVKDNDPARLYIGGNNFNGEADQREVSDVSRQSFGRGISSRGAEVAA
jgi:hypothetical protein